MLALFISLSTVLAPCKTKQNGCEKSFILKFINDDIQAYVHETLKILCIFRKTTENNANRFKNVLC